MAEYTSQRFDELFAGGLIPERMTAVVVKSGVGVITRGTVVGVVGQLPESDLLAGTPIVAPVDSTKTDGSQYPYGVIADTVIDATAANGPGAVYLDGEFNRDALKFGGTDTVAQHEVAMRNVGLITKRVVK